LLILSLNLLLNLLMCIYRAIRSSWWSIHDSCWTESQCSCRRVRTCTRTWRHWDWLQQSTLCWDRKRGC